MARAPRPILKTTPEQLSDPDQTSLPFASCSQSQLLQHHALHVHFPPTPHLARMEITHSPNTYDRAPIVVVPNDCAMPDRGCRSYGDGDRKSQSKHRKRSQCAAAPGTGTPAGTDTLDCHQRTSMKHIESYFHPRAFEASSSPPPYSNNNIGKDREDAEPEDADTNQSLFAALSPSLIMTTASWTPPLTRSSSPSLSSSSFASSSDEASSLVPVPVYSQSQLQAQQSKSSDGADAEETAFMLPAAAVPSTPLNALALTLLPYLPPSSSSSPSPKSSKKKKGAVAASSSAGENNSGKRRSRDLDCLTAYTRWSSPFSDPASDSCLGGF